MHASMARQTRYAPSALSQTPMAASQRLLAAALLLMAARQALAGFYGTSDDVVTLTPANFDQLVGQNGSIWLVELYAQW